MHCYPLNVTLMLLLCPAIFLGAKRVTVSLKGWWRLTAMVGALLLLLGYLVFLMDGVLLADLLPVDDVLAFGQWSPQLAALLLGVAWPGLSKRRWRRWLLAGGAWVLAVILATTPGWKPVPTIRELELRGCVLQTSSASCGAAATANLLRQHGIPATEREMADLCLTATDGTWFHGMVRGLRIRGVGTGLVARAGFAGVDDLVAGRVRLPAILSLYLSPATARRDPRYHEDWGWVIGQRHVVVLLGFDGDRPFVADPGTGFEHWSRQALDDLFAGRVIWLGGR